MKTGWQRKRLGEVLQCIETVNPLQNPEAEFDYIDVSSVSNKTFQIEITQRLKGSEAPSRARRLVRGGDILFATVRPTLQRIAIVPDDLDGQVCSTGYFVLRPKQEIDHKFLFYSLFNSGFLKQMGALQKGASYPAVTDGDVRAQLLLFPPLPEQQRIVALLDQAFEGIATAKANAEKNLQNARELFESHLNAVFTQRGEGWVELTLESLTEKITKGSSPKWQGVEYVDEPGILFITSENVGPGKMVYKKTKYVEDSFNQKDSKSILCKGDVLTNIVGASIGRTAIFDRDDIANINQAVCLIRCDKDKLNNKYLSYLLNSPYFVRVLHDNEIDNARANLSLGFFRSLRIPLPNLVIQQNIIDGMDAISKETGLLEANYQQKLAALDELKQSLLHKAFAGEL